MAVKIKGLTHYIGVDGNASLTTAMDRIINSQKIQIHKDREQVKRAKAGIDWRLKKG